MARERPALLSFYHEVIGYDLITGGGHPLRAIREDISRAEFGPDDRQDLEKHDQEWVDYILVMEEADIWPGLLEDDPAQPPEKWWWHLGAIRRREYPAGLLPEHLRRVYGDAVSSAGDSEAI